MTTSAPSGSELFYSATGESTNSSWNFSTFYSSTMTGDSTTKANDSPDTEYRYHFIIGIILAMSSCLFIGSSFIVKKKALLRIERHNASRAGLGGYGYLKEWMWWLGFILLGSGEAANFVAYAFAPATLVTPLGALSVLVSAVLASYILNENLNVLGKIGCFMCILGAVAIILHAPREEIVSDMKELEGMLREPGIIIYIILVILSSLVLMFYFGPRCGNNNMLIYITICSVIGSLSVMACKGLGVAVIETANGVNQFTNWLTWFLIISLVITISVQMNYLNKALDLYNTSIVSAVYYVFFTTAVLVASAILFKEWEHMTVTNLIGVFTGFAIIICGIFMLNVFKDFDVTLTTVQSLIRNQVPSTTEPSETTALFPETSRRDNNESDDDKIRKHDSVTVELNKDET